MGNRYWNLINDDIDGIDGIDGIDSIDNTSKSSGRTPRIRVPGTRQVTDLLPP